MNRRLVFSALALALGATYAVPAFSQAKPDVLVDLLLGGARA